MSAKRTTLGRYTPKYPQLDERLLDWFTEQWSQDKFSFYAIANFNTISCDEFVYQGTKGGNGQLWLVSFIYSEETAEQADEEEVDDEFNTGTKDEQ